jgi:hypothetical protein
MLVGGLGLALALVVCFCVFHRRKNIFHWVALLEGNVFQKVILFAVLLFCLGHTLTQKTTYPVTHVGMFEKANFERLTKETEIFAPAMYCHYVDGGLRVESIRRASLFLAGDLDLDSHIYLGMIYFKWRHTKYVSDIITRAGQRVGLDLVPMNLVYSIDSDVHFISEAPSQLTVSTSLFRDGRIYIK